jgi:SSS family solute:Na+ symporter
MQLVRIGRFVTALVMIVGIVWAPQIVRFPSLWTYFQSILAYATPPVIAIFFMGILWRRATPYAAFWTFTIGLGVGVTGFVLNEIQGAFHVHFLYAACALFVLGLVLMVVISQLTPQEEDEEVDALIWRTHLWHEESRELAGKPAWQNYRYQSVALLMVTAGILIWWW